MIDIVKLFSGLIFKENGGGILWWDFSLRDFVAAGFAQSLCSFAHPLHLAGGALAKKKA